MKKEVIVGSLVLLFIIAFVVIFTRIKSSGALSRQIKIYALADNTFHLHVGQFVYYNGLEMGRVVSIDAVPNVDKQYLIGLSLHTQASLPKHTKAQITYVTVLGGREVNLTVDSTIATTGYLNSGDTISAYIHSIPTQVKTALTPVTNFLDTFFMKYPNDSLEQMFYDLQATLNNYQEKTTAISNNLRKQVPALNTKIADYRKLSEDLNKKMPEYMQQLKSINATLKATADKGIDKSIQATTNKIENFGNTIEAQAPKIQQVNNTIDTINAQLKVLPQNPTLKKYVYDESLPADLHKQVNEVQSTIKAVYQDPKQFIKPEKE